MCLRGVQFFLFSAVCLQFSAVCLQFVKKIGRFSNAFWLYQHRVRNAQFQSYSQKTFQILIWVTLYLLPSTVHKDADDNHEEKRAPSSVRTLCMCVVQWPGRLLLLTAESLEDFSALSTSMARQLSWLERRANNAKVTGSIPLRAISFCIFF